MALMPISQIRNYPSVNAIDIKHVTPRPTEPKESSHFLKSSAGIYSKFSPAPNFDGYGMNSATGIPVLHKMQFESGDVEPTRSSGECVETYGNGAFDNFSFHCVDSTDFSERLRKADPHHSARAAPGERLHQPRVMKPSDKNYDFISRQAAPASWVMGDSGIATGATA